MINNSVTKAAFIIILVILAILLFFCLLRAVRGPKIADRLMSVNMIGTMIIVIICILSLFLKESYLMDVALVYSMLSFLAVVLISKVYMGVYAEHKKKQEEEEKEKIVYEEEVRNGDD
ncbi:MAG: sodium:proton antiporter [Lachnospiraceae bacterium]|nr:sodium:proton antiporter [Lachnospiraceae bacterium]